MSSSRRAFLKASGLALGATTLPPWLLEREAAEAAALDKPALAEIALRAAKGLGATYADIRISRYRTEQLMTREAQVPWSCSG